MISTWISDHEIPSLSKVEDKELNELFQEVRESFGGSFMIQTTPYDRRTWWDKLTSNYKKTGVLYTLYHYHKLPDAQIINFAQDHSWSINTMVSKAFIMTYFFGLLGGKNFNPTPKQ